MSEGKNKAKKDRNSSKTDLPDMKTNSDTKRNTANLQEDSRHTETI